MIRVDIKGEWWHNISPQLYLGRLDRRPGERKRETEKRCVAEILADFHGREMRLEHSCSGAPYLPDYPGEFVSISHSDSFVLVAVAREPIGVDIEDIGGQVERVEQKFVNFGEIDRLENMSSKRLALHLLWSAKEAAYKLKNPSSASLKEFTLTVLEDYDPYHNVASFALCTSMREVLKVSLGWTVEYVMAIARY